MIREHKTICWRNSRGLTAPVEGNGQTIFQIENLHLDQKSRGMMGSIKKRGGESVYID